MANRFLKFHCGDLCNLRVVDCDLYSCVEGPDGLFKVDGWGNNKILGHNYWSNYLVPIELITHKVFRCDTSPTIQYFVKYVAFSRVLGGQEMDEL